VEPVSLTEAKAQLRIDGTDEDTLIGMLIESARDYVETVTRRALINQTWYAYMDAFPSERDFLYLPKCPLSSVTSVKYTDTDSVLQTWGSSNYVVDAQTSSPGRISLAYNADWPTSVKPQANSIVIEYVAGYGATSASVPASIRQAVLLILAHWYENRESVALGAIATEIPMSAKSLLAANRIIEAPVYIYD
jgi:uncharacterized phiE125 gp8 family phage protein